MTSPVCERRLHARHADRDRWDALNLRPAQLQYGHRHAHVCMCAAYDVHYWSHVCTFVFACPLPRAGTEPLPAPATVVSGGSPSSTPRTCPVSARVAATRRHLSECVISDSGFRAFDIFPPVTTQVSGVTGEGEWVSV